MSNEKDTPSTRPGANRKIIALSLAGKILRFHKSRVVIGSVVSADIRLTGDGVSPIHAVLELGAEGATVYDLASETGVFVNGQKTVTRKLASGEDITIGRHTLKFSMEDIDRIAPDTRVRESAGRKLFVNPGEDLNVLLLEDERVVEDIFDYRPTHQLALQVVMSWRGTILDVEHFVEEREVTLGQTRKSHFGIPPLLGVKEFSIVTRSGEHHVLNLDSQMKGVMHRKGELKSLDEMRGGVVQSTRGAQVPLEKGDFAKIAIGEIDFYLSFTAAPPHLKRGRLVDRDPLFWKLIAASVLLTTMTIFALMQIPRDQELEAEEIPERIATILYQPEKFSVPPVQVQKTQAKPPTETTPPPKQSKSTPEPTPQKTVKIDVTPKNQVKQVPKEMNVAQNQNKSTTAQTRPKGQTKAQNEAKEGEGARAKGKEGSRGSKNAAKSNDKQNKAVRPSAMGGGGAGAGDSQIRDQGNVDILKDATGKIQDLLGNSAAKLGKDGDRLKGFGGFNTQGEGGLALSGTGSGGGGDAASLGGMGNKGRGGGKVGTGLGAAGSGNGIIGGAARTVLRTGGPEETVIMGAIDASAIEAAILREAQRFRRCYEKEINAEAPAKGGSVLTNFVINSSGRVTQAGVEKSTLGVPNTEGCILDVIKSIAFPIPRGAGIVQVTFPFKFNPVGK